MKKHKEQRVRMRTKDSLVKIQALLNVLHSDHRVMESVTSGIWAAHIECFKKVNAVRTLVRGCLLLSLCLQIAPNKSAGSTNICTIPKTNPKVSGTAFNLQTQRHTATLWHVLLAWPSTRYSAFSHFCASRFAWYFGSPTNMQNNFSDCGLKRSVLERDLVSQARNLQIEL